MLHRIYHLTIQCGDRIKVMSVSCIDPCTYEEMMISAISKVGADRVIELIAK